MLIIFFLVSCFLSWCTAPFDFICCLWLLNSEWPLNTFVPVHCHQTNKHLYFDRSSTTTNHRTFIIQLYYKLNMLFFKGSRNLIMLFCLGGHQYFNLNESWRSISLCNSLSSGVVMTHLMHRWWEIIHWSVINKQILDWIVCLVCREMSQKLLKISKR